MDGAAPSIAPQGCSVAQKPNQQLIINDLYFVKKIPNKKRIDFILKRFLPDMKKSSWEAIPFWVH